MPCVFALCACLAVAETDNAPGLLLGLLRAATATARAAATAAAAAAKAGDGTGDGAAAAAGAAAKLAHVAVGALTASASLGSIQGAGQINQVRVVGSDAELGAVGRREAALEMVGEQLAGLQVLACIACCHLLSPVLLSATRSQLTLASGRAWRRLLGRRRSRAVQVI